MRPVQQFRYSFSSPENARDLARNLLPSSYRRMVEGARVTVDNKSYIEAELREQFTDLLIRFDPPAEDPSSRDGGAGGPAGAPARKTGRAEGGGTLYLYVLVEHKSQPKRWTPFQLLRYMLAVWSDVLRRGRPKPKRLPPILPVVLYQGTREWNAPLAFEALVDTAPAGGAQAGESREHQDSAAHTPRHIPRFEPLFVNLQSLSDEELHGGVRAVVALLFLKYLVRRIDREAARVLLEAMHREGVTREDRQYYQAFYTALRTLSASMRPSMSSSSLRRRKRCSRSCSSGAPPATASARSTPSCSAQAASHAVPNVTTPQSHKTSHS